MNSNKTWQGQGADVLLAPVLTAEYGYQFLHQSVRRW